VNSSACNLTASLFFVCTFSPPNNNPQQQHQKNIKQSQAMLACLGFAAQAWTTGTTPLANLGAHLADPWGTTVFSNDLARL
jgi:hypothetical protein